ncbi:uncharacterized protein LOC124812274 isoform X3 [Hydra vulgaris]|nr:uncharacterized protein LOC124812274 isoform X3 [Hydra vulgaris]
MEFIKTSIIRILPSIDATLLEQLATSLELDVGVETQADLHLVTFEDLFGLKPIQKRKLLQSWLSNNVADSNMLTPALMTLSSPCIPCSSTEILAAEGSSAASNYFGPSDWCMLFNVPWGKIDKKTIEKLESGERLSATERTAMVRIVLDEVRSVCLKPLKKHLDIIASIIVLKYPKALKDEYNGNLIGSGHDSLTLQLVNRYDYLQRPRRALPEVDFEVEKVSAEDDEKKHPFMNRKRDSYGCLNWECTGLLSSQSTPAEKLYRLQQSAINGNLILLPELMQQFPELFTVSGLLNHFDVLMGGLKATEKLTTSLADQKLAAFLLNCKSTNEHIKKAMQSMDELKVATASDLPVAPSLMTALVFLFDEMLHCLFLLMDETTDMSEVPRGQLLTPHLCVLGIEVAMHKEGDDCQ